MTEPDTSRAVRMADAGPIAGSGKVVGADRATDLLAAALRCGDRVILEGDNQKQGDFLAEALTGLDPERIHDLHLCLSTIGLPAHLDLFEIGLARRVAFCYAGPQGGRLARMVDEGRIEIAGIHTYPELIARYALDLRPNVVLLVAESADRDGNLFTGPNTEETPALAEAGAFNDAVVIVQANRIVDKVERVDIPGEWVDFVIESPRPFHMEPLFTRDPAKVTELQILMAMMALKAIYARYLPASLNHGVGYDTAAIELLLPTYGAELGLKGRAVTHWMVNPLPTLIPAIESGFVEAVACVGGEIGMEDYVRARRGIFSVGRDGSLRSNRFSQQITGHYVDMFIGATLQIDPRGNSSTVTRDRLVGFGGAPNLGCDSRSRRHLSPAFVAAGREAHGAGATQGRKLVVQMVETFHAGRSPAFVETLEAVEVAGRIGADLPPIMIHGDDVTHVVTEEGVANLLLCRSLEEREQAIRGVAGYTDVGRARDAAKVAELRRRGIIQGPEDLGISRLAASRDLLAARSIKDLVRWSGGLYAPPARFRNW